MRFLFKTASLKLFLHDLLGLEASNNSDMGDYTDHVQRVFHGRLLAYIQASGAEGIIKVKFTSPWLKEIQTEIATK